MNLRLNKKKSLIDKIFSSNLWVRLTYILFFAHLILIIATFLDYGITYDEDWHASYGEQIIRWYSSFFQDREALTFWILIYYGGFFDVIAQLAAKISQMGIYETRHLLNALFGLLGVIGTYKLGIYLGGPLTGFISAFFLILTPSFYGHAFNNPKDIPFAAFYMFSLYYLIKSIGFFPRIPKRLSAKLGIAIGLTLGIRVGGILLLAYLGFAFFLWLIIRYILKYEHPLGEISIKSTFMTFFGRYLGICMIAYLVMLVWWPAAQVRPIAQPVKALLFSGHFPYSQPVFFEGKTILSTNLPWYYVPKWFLISLPEFYFIVLAVGMVLGGISITQSRKRLSILKNKGALEILVLLVSIAFPLVYTFLTGPTVYDGIRHYSFIVPPLAVLAALSLSKMMKRITSFASVPIMTAVVVSIVITVVDMVQLHPYQTIYFNRLFGKGVAEAAKSFETDYWGNSYKEGVEYVVKNYKNPYEGRKVKVASCLHSLSTSYFLPEDRFEYLGSFHHGQRISGEKDPDLFLATPRWGCNEKLRGKVLHVIERKGAPLLYIIEVEKGSKVKSE